MTDDYNTFTDRFARNCAVRRAEEAEHQRAMRPQRPSSSEPLVYKTYHSPAPQPQQSATVNMDQQTQDAWNDWARAHVADGLRELAPQITKALDDLQGETGKALDAIVDEINQVTGDLADALIRQREKNTKLRSDVEVLRVMLRSQNVGVTMRSKRDVA
jgi:hypothetical protein